MNEDYKRVVKDPAILEMLEKLKDMPERLERQKREYYERKKFVKEVFGKAVEQALGIKVED